MPHTAATSRPVRVDFAGHAERLRLAIERALEQAVALNEGWFLDADPNTPADYEAGATLDRLVADLRAAQHKAAGVEQLVRDATTTQQETPTHA